MSNNIIFICQDSFFNTVPLTTSLAIRFKYEHQITVIDISFSQLANLPDCPQKTFSTSSPNLIIG